MKIGMEKARKLLSDLTVCWGGPNGPVETFVVNESEDGCAVSLRNGVVISIQCGGQVMSDGVRTVEVLSSVHNGYEMPECSYELFGRRTYLLVPGYGDEPNVGWLSIKHTGGKDCLAEYICAANKIQLSSSVSFTR